MEAVYGQTQFGLEPETSERTLRLSTLVEALRMLIQHANDTTHAPQMAPPQSRLRQHARRPIAIRASCRGSWGSSDCLIADMSEGGARVVCGHAPGIGERVTLEWPTAASEQPFQVLCLVRHVSAGHTGVAFLGVSTQDMQHITAALRAC